VRLEPTTDEAGLSARSAADQLGHAKPSLTADIYIGRRKRATGAAEVLEDLTATAGATRTIRLGTQVASPNFRHPVMFAKELMTLDHISDGRIEAGVGAGSNGPDAVVLGDAPLTGRARFARFAEWLDLLDRLLREPVGMARVVSKKKPDFIGKRSFARADNLWPDRKQLVVLLPEDRDLLLPEGSQVVEGPNLPEPPVPMLGHVTSSYHSAALEQTFALALIKAGRSRIGQAVYVPVGGALVPVEVAEPVVFDPVGSRRDG
jgi:hypothetical protein